MHTRPTPDAAARILGGNMEPGLMGRAPTSNPSPLSGDVLRAYDTYNSEIAAAANLPSYSPVFKVMLQDVGGIPH